MRSRRDNELHEIFMVEKPRDKDETTARWLISVRSQMVAGGHRFFNGKPFKADVSRLILTTEEHEHLPHGS